MVELIVVLVILAILAAIMVPALLGWIDKAREKQIVINARSAYLAAQTLASEAYGAHGASATATQKTISIQSVKDLAGVQGSLTGTITMTNLTSGGTSEVVLYYTEGTGKTVKYDTSATGSKQWELDDTTTPPTTLQWEIAS